MSSRPSSPTKSDLKPNPHPYAIKTTSTGILSRSGSTSNSTAHSRNHYVPLPPSPSPSPTKPRTPSSRHRYSRSLTDDIPRPLPAPPDDPAYYRGRAETLPALSDAANPKHWTPVQLAAHFPEIAEFVEEHDITGRAFLRFDDGVLDAYGVTQKHQRKLLLNASHSLRRSLQSYRKQHPGPDNYFQTLSRSPSPSKPHDNHDLYEPNDNDQTLPSSLSPTNHKHRYKPKPRPNSRVHNIVTSLERPPEPFDSDNYNTYRRERSGSISSIGSSTSASSDTDSHRHHFPPAAARSGRPLPFPPQPPYLLPSLQTGETSPFQTPQTTGDSAYSYAEYRSSPDGDLNQHQHQQRPLPHEPARGSTQGGWGAAEIGRRRNFSGDELMMDQLLGLLEGDRVETGGENGGDGAGELGMETVKEWSGRALPVPPIHPSLVGLSSSNGESGDKKREGGKDKGKGKRKGGVDAWVDDIGVGDTVKRVPLGGATREVRVTGGEEEMTIEELLKLEVEGGNVDKNGGEIREGKESKARRKGKGRRRGGVDAWVDDVGVGETVKRVDGSAGGVGDGEVGESAKRRGVDEVFAVVDGGSGSEERGEEKERTTDIVQAFLEQHEEQLGGEKERGDGDVVTPEIEMKADVEDRESTMGIVQAFLAQHEEQQQQLEELRQEQARLQEMERRESERREEIEDSRVAKLMSQIEGTRKEIRDFHIRLEEVGGLMKDIGEARREIGDFRARLEEVERRVGGMEVEVGRVLPLVQAEAKARERERAVRGPPPEIQEGQRERGGVDVRTRVCELSAAVVGLYRAVVGLGGDVYGVLLGSKLVPRWKGGSGVLLWCGSVGVWMRSLFERGVMRGLGVMKGVREGMGRGVPRWVLLMGIGVGVVLVRGVGGVLGGRAGRGLGRGGYIVRGRR